MEAVSGLTVTPRSLKHNVVTNPALKSHVWHQEVPTTVFAELFEDCEIHRPPG